MITLELVNVVQVEVKNLSKSLHDECEDRPWEFMKKDLRNMIQLEGVMKVYQSLCAQTACEKLAWPTQLETHARADYELVIWACGVVVSMFDFHRSDRGSNPGRGSEFS